MKEAVCLKYLPDIVNVVLAGCSSESMGIITIAEYPLHYRDGRTIKVSCYRGEKESSLILSENAHNDRKEIFFLVEDLLNFERSFIVEEKRIGDIVCRREWAITGRRRIE